MKYIKRIPLRYKLLVLLVTLTSLSLLVYARLALNIFEEDKLAYVFDSSLAHVEAVAKQFRSEVEFDSSKIQFYMKGYQTNLAAFHPYTLSIQPSDPFLDGIWTYHLDESSALYILKGESTKLGLDPELKEHLFNSSLNLISSALENKIGISAVTNRPGYWFLSMKYQQSEQEKPIVVIALFNRGSFLDFFSNPQLQDTFLVSQNNRVLLKPLQPTYPELSNTELEEALQYLSKPENSKSSVHIWKKTNSSSSPPSWLLSTISIGVGDLKIVSFVPKNAALATVRLLAVKSTLFLILLIGFASIVSVVAAHQLTGSLKRLFEATRKVATGNFDIEVPVESEDEVGGLTRGFNHMTQEIKRLLITTAEKSRMESELLTAKTVQATLFPNPKFSSNTISIEGYYEPASECGGDWWYYTRIGSITYLLIGDATGHGVPAALVTSAARSAARIFEELPEQSIDYLMSLLNKAINGTSGGQVNMTFFLASFDESTGTLQYSNASHDPPFLIRSKAGEKLQKSDIIPLMNAPGRRLGESPDSVYSVAQEKLNPGDKLVFYTDGVTELRNPAGELWGERKFIRTILKTLNSDDSSLDAAMKSLHLGMLEHRQDALLNDDVTYFMLHYSRVG
ncbi:MAG: SpoIIE family protein phosphatase [Bdellovibrionales bacterium]|nr:SpoIIE family protein phosphatase [Bdellovibrionales bacterium]